MKRVEYDINKSEYYFKVNKLTLFFSSKFNKTRFENGFIEYVQEETNKIKAKYKVDINLTNYLLLAYYKNTPILGVPSCAMYAKRTILDLVLPRVLADEKLTFEDIASYGNGGMCLSCEICSFPHCSFGK